MDVESLFTNVSVQHTIEIILNSVWNHPSMPPLKIKKETLQEMLTISTIRTPFEHINGG